MMKEEILHNIVKEFAEDIRSIIFYEPIEREVDLDIIDETYNEYMNF